MKVIVSGRVAVYDLETKHEINDPDELRKLDGLLYNAERIADYIDEAPLDEIGLEGGDIRLAFDPTAKQLRIVSAFRSPRPLSTEEVAALTDFITGQWSDGVGENCFVDEADAHGLGIFMGPVHTEKAAVEQINEDAEVVGVTRRDTVAHQPDEPTSDKSQLPTLFVFGIAGLLLGYVALAACLGAAVGINVVHNLLPRFIFILPIIALALLALTPMVYGLAVGAGVAHSARMLGHSHPESAGLVSLFWAIAGLVGGWFGAGDYWFPGQALYQDVILPFVRLMVGAAIQIEWLKKPEPASVPSWIVATVLIVSSLLGVLIAYGHTDQELRPPEQEQEAASQQTE